MQVLQNVLVWRRLVGKDVKSYRKEDTVGTKGTLVTLRVDKVTLPLDPKPKSPWLSG